MTRRFNYTARARITSDHFSARVISEKPLTASLHLDLSSLELPGTADVLIEPYAGTVSERISCGKVSALMVPRSIDVDHLKTGGSIQFRVKVVDANGRLVAAANRIKLHGLDEDSGRRPLLPVETTPELGEEIWRVIVDESTYPKLQLNSRVPSIERRLVEDPVVAGAILVPAVRRILEVLTESLDGDVWQPDWLNFATRWSPDIDPERDLDPEAQASIVELVVDGFAREQAFVRRLVMGQDEGSTL
jgi:hypothetical protein